MKRTEWTLEERQHLHVMLRVGKSFEEIGKFLGRNRKVVKRASTRYEPKSPIVKRNQTPLERALWDHQKHHELLRKPKNRVRLGNLERQRYVETKLPKASPEQIAGRYKRDHPGESMSPETIYLWIYECRRDLIKHLVIVSKRGNRKRTSRKKYRYKQQSLAKRCISQRSEQANNRKRIGDFERDTVHGIKGTKACILNSSDRKSRLVILDKLHACSSEAAKSASKRRLKKLSSKMKLTMTQDNGPENYFFSEEEQELGIKQFFCRPYSAFERGTVEVLNRFAVRRLFPKGTDFTYVNFEQVKEAETAHNNRPMKCLGFRTPLEVFNEELVKYKLKPEDLDLRYIPW